MGTYRNSNILPDIGRRSIRYGCLRTYHWAIKASPYLYYVSSLVLV